MRTSMAMGYTHGLKAFLKVLLCVVLVVSLCPPMTGAFADEPDGVEQTPATEQANADGQEGASAEATGDAEMGIASDAGESSANGEDAERTESVPRADEPKEAGDAESESAAATDESESASAEEESEEMVLSAEADGVRAVVTVAAGVELPEGAHVVVTPLLKAKAQEGATDGEAADEAAGATEEAVADEEAASDEAAEGAEEDAVEASSEDSEETTGDAADEAVAEDAEQAAAEEGASERITGAEVVVNGMSDAVTTYLKKKDADARADFTVADAYAVEVLDEQGGIVPLGEDQAKLMLTVLSEENAETPDGVYAVDRQGAAEGATEQEIAAAEKPVSDVAEEEYTDEQQASETITYDGEATELADDAVKKDEESGETTVEVDGVQDVVMVQDANSLAAARPGGPLGVAPGNPDTANLGPVTDGRATMATVDHKQYGITMNLFDYDISDNSSNHYGSPDTGGINTGRSESNQLMFYAYGTAGTSSGAHGTFRDRNDLNHFTGFDGGNLYNTQYANQGIVQSQLSGNYPKLNTGASDSSTEYLFNPDTAATGKHAYKDVNKLFTAYEDLEYTDRTQNKKYLLDEMLIYDSNDSYAYYDRSDQNTEKAFHVYDGTFIRKNGQDDGMMVGFFPFTKPESNWWNNNESTAPEINATRATPPVNHHLGMTLDIPFKMPYNGYMKKDEDCSHSVTQYDPMIFEFSGDDDMWVFIDGKLALDIGGIHQPVRGTINFATGVVKLTYGTKVQVRFDQNDEYAYTASGVTTTASDLSRGTTVYLYTENGHTGILGERPRAGSEHTLKAFYLERGGCDSNLRLATNVHTPDTNDLSITKDWEDEDNYDKPESVKIQVLRKAVERIIEVDDSGEIIHVHDDANAQHREKVSAYQEIDLTDSDNWTAALSEAPISGYETIDGNEVYCDYTYYVREVPMTGFKPSYYSGDSETPLATTSFGEADGVDEDHAGDYAAFDSANRVRVKNTPVYTSIDVEKAWDVAPEGNVSIFASINEAEGDSELVDATTLTAADATSGSDGKTWSTKVEKILVKDDSHLLGEESLTAGGDTLPVGSTFSVGGKTYRHVSTKYYDFEGNEIESGGIDRSVEGYAGKIVFTNELVKANVVLHKVSLHDEEESLSGAKFKVFVDNPTAGTPGSYDAEDQEYYEQPYVDAEGKLTTDEDGVIELKDLYPGVYWVLETDAPTGYVKRSLGNPIRVEVNDDGSVENFDATDANGKTSLKTDDDVNTLTVPNTPLYTLPAAGGMGILEFLFLGAFVMALAAGISLIRRKYPLGIPHAAQATRGGDA